jgi:hypothetical protein
MARLSPAVRVRGVVDGPVGWWSWLELGEPGGVWRRPLKTALFLLPGFRGPSGSDWGRIYTRRHLFAHTQLELPPACSWGSGVGRVDDRVGLLSAPCQMAPGSGQVPPGFFAIQRAAHCCLHRNTALTNRGLRQKQDRGTRWHSGGGLQHATSRPKYQVDLGCGGGSSQGGGACAQQRCCRLPQRGALSAPAARSACKPRQGKARRTTPAAARVNLALTDIASYWGNHFLSS